MNQQGNKQPSRLLVVDDNEDNRDMLYRRLRRLGHKVELADGGQQALDMLEKKSYDLVLLDIMMPDIDGLKVLRKVRETINGNQLPIIMATAKTQSEDVVEALRLGANDYVTKPIDFPVLRARVETQLRLKQATQSLDEAYQRMKEDLDSAAEVQKALLPSSFPDTPGITFAWKYVPCDELAGDILNVVRLDEQHLGLYVLDVSGHGVPAALFSSALSHVLSADGGVLRQRQGGDGAWEITPPAEVAQRLNKRFPMSDDILLYFTLVYGVLDLVDHTFRFICAGHPPPVKLQPGREPEIQEAGGSPIGFLEDAVYEESCIQLLSGERLYLYTDGILEAMNEERQEYDYKRFMPSLEDGRTLDLDESIDTVINSVQKWMSGPPQDDITMLAVGID